MTRTSQEITQAENNAYTRFCQQHNIVNEENEAGYRNGELLGGLIVIEWQMDITAATLANAYSKIKEHLTHYTPLQLEHRQLAGRMTEQDRNAILHAITSRG